MSLSMPKPVELCLNLVFNQRGGSSVARSLRRVLPILLLLLGGIFAPQPGWSATAPAATTTTLSVASGALVVSTVTSGTVVTLMAHVTSGSTAASTGIVNFCDASALLCSDIHRLASLPVNAAGNVIFKFRPPVGSHKYKAVFVATKTLASSTSAVSALTVTAIAKPVATTTQIDAAGSWGSYNLSASVVGTGSTQPLTGSVQFLDASKSNLVLGTGTLGTTTKGLAWPSPIVGASASIGGILFTDLNGDGINDRVLLQSAPASPVSVQLGKGDGSFGASIVPTLSIESPEQVVAGDFNHDGMKDLAVLDQYTGTITILLGDGTGKFQATATPVSFSFTPVNFAVADLNGDGILDLVANSSYSNQIQVLPGKGDGSFGAAVLSSCNSGYINSMSIGDFNGDGIPDLLIMGGYSSTIEVMKGKGDGSFLGGATTDTPGVTSQVVVADFDGDGKLDAAILAAGNLTSGNQLEILKGDGTGKLSLPTVVPSTSAQVNLALGDFNGDGIADVAVLDSRGVFQIYLGNGKGAFTQIERQLVVTSSAISAISVGDFDGDGWSDLEISYSNSTTPVRYLTRAQETATATAAASLPTSGIHQIVASYQGSTNFVSSKSAALSLWGTPSATTTTLTLTAGGKTVSTVVPGTVVTLSASVKTNSTTLTSGSVKFCEASAASCSDQNLLGTATLTAKGQASFSFTPHVGSHQLKAVFAAEGAGAASTSNSVALTVGPAPTPTFTTTAALDSDGAPGNYSLNATVTSTGTTSVTPTGSVSFVDTSFSNKVLATKTLSPTSSGIGWVVSATNPLGGSNLITSVAGDFNGDGIEDLAVLWSTSSGYSPVSETTLLGNGKGGYTLGTTIAMPATSEAAASMVAGDFNGDGKLDLAVLYHNSNQASVAFFAGAGNGSFAAPVTSAIAAISNYWSDNTPGAMVAVDLNGDGKLDLGIVDIYSDTGGVIAAFGKGDGSFTVNGITSHLRVFDSLAAADLNGDGMPDIIACSYGDEYFCEVMLNRGDGSLKAGSPIMFSATPSSVSIADFNQDGKPDAVIGFMDGAQILLGKGDGSFTATDKVQGDAQQIVIGDFDHDGSVDVVGVNNYGMTPSLYKGDGKGGLTRQVVAATGANFSSPVWIAKTDLNKDGWPELAVLCHYQAAVSLFVPSFYQTAKATVTGIAPIGTGYHLVDAVYSGDTLHAKATSDTISLTAGLKPPVITPTDGVLTSVPTVTITEAFAGATIYYRVVGTNSTYGYVKYTGPFSLPYGGSQILSAYATETGYQQSAFTYVTYNLSFPQAPTPVLSLASGLYKTAQKLTITDAAPQAKIYYTTDGSPAYTTSTLYTGPITISGDEVISAMAVAPGYQQSLTTEGEYLIAGSASRLVYTIAGTGYEGFSNVTAPGAQSTLVGPNALVRDASGNLYIGDNYGIHKLNATTGLMSLIAGDGVRGYSGDGGLATKARVGYLTYLTLDKSGNLYLSDSAYCVVRKITAATGIISTVAGNGTCTTDTSTPTAIKSSLNYIHSIAVDGSGNLYIGTVSRILKVAATSSVVSVVTGDGNYGYTGDKGLAVNAEIGIPSAITFDASGNFYFADLYQNTVRRIGAANGIITTVAGVPMSSGSQGTSKLDGSLATNANLLQPDGLAIDTAGNLYIAEYGNYDIREVTAKDQIIHTIAGGNGFNGLGGQGEPALAAMMGTLTELQVDASGNLYVADLSLNRVFKITPLATTPTAVSAAPSFSLAAGTYTTAQSLKLSAGTNAEIFFSVDGSTPITYQYGYYKPLPITGSVTVKAIALEPGKLPSAVVSMSYSITAKPAATISTVAGSGVTGMGTDGLTALKEKFGPITSVAVNSLGDVYMADPNYGVIWKLTAATRIVSVAAGIPGYRGGYLQNNTPATQEVLYTPTYIAVDHADNLYISDSGYRMVLRVDAKTGILTGYAGMNPNGNTNGDGGPAIYGTLQAPWGIAFDSKNNLYIADSGLNNVRKVTATTGIITTVAGSSSGVLSDGGLATAAQLQAPRAVAVDASGNIFIYESTTTKIREVSATTGIITTVAGTGAPGNFGDGGKATAAGVLATNLAVNNSGVVYFSTPTGIIRKFLPGGIISTVVGTGYNGFSGDAGDPVGAQLYRPDGLAFDARANLYIADQYNYRVRKVTFPTMAASASTTSVVQ